MRAFIASMLAFASVAFAQQQDFSKVEVKAAKVAGNVYVLTGSGGNIGATVGDDGVAIIDDQFRRSRRRSGSSRPSRCDS